MSHPLCLQHIRLLSPSLALFLPLSIRHTNMSISNAQSGVCIHTIRAILLFLLQLFMDYCFHLNVYTLLLHCTHKVGSLSLSLFHSKSIRIGISSSSLLRTMHLFHLWILCMFESVLKPISNIICYLVSKYSPKSKNDATFFSMLA